MKRLTEQGQTVTRRDDETVIVEEQDKKWIRFSDKTQYLHEGDDLIIERDDYPVFKLQPADTAVVTYHGVEVRSVKN